MEIEDFIKGKHNKLIMGKWETNPVDLGFNYTDENVWKDYFESIKKIWIKLEILERLRFYLVDNINNPDENEKEPFSTLFRLMLDGLNREQTISQKSPIPIENSFIEFIQKYIGITISEEWIQNCSSEEDIQYCKRVELLDDKFNINILKASIDKVLSIQSYVDMEFSDIDAQVTEISTSAKNIWDLWLNLITDLSNILVWVSQQTTFIFTIRWITRTYLERCYPIFKVGKQLRWLIDTFSLDKLKLTKISEELQQTYEILKFCDNGLGDTLLDLEKSVKKYLVNENLIENFDFSNDYIRKGLSNVTIDKNEFSIVAKERPGYSHSTQTVGDRYHSGSIWNIDNFRCSCKIYNFKNYKNQTFDIPIHQLIETLSPLIFIGWGTPIHDEKDFWIRNS